MDLVEQSDGAAAWPQCNTCVIQLGLLSPSPVGAHSTAAETRSAAQSPETVTPYAALQNRLSRGECVVLDGGVGSELVRRGVRWRVNGLRTDADTVANVHDAYLEAGADVLRTNTFQLNRRTYRNVFRDAAHMRHIGAPDLEQRVPELVPRAVALAKEARERANRPDVAIAGVMSPLEHCFRPDLAPSDGEASAEHHEIAQLLAGAGVA